MAQQIINVGATPNDGAGDPIRTAFTKCNNNFGQLYSRVQVSPPTSLIGQIGDEAGMYAYDPTYFYYCFADYDGSSIIWAQVTQVGNISTNQIVSGNSNVVISGSGGDVIMGVNGTANVAVFSSTGVSIPGNVTTGAYFLGDGSLLTGLPQTYANANVTAYAEAGWAGNIVPSANAVYNLGSPAQQFKDLYLSGNSLYLGTLQITANATQMFVAGNSVLTTNAPISGNISVAGNISAGNLEAANNIVVLDTGYIYNISSTGLSSLTTVTATTVSATGDVTGGNIVTANLVSAGNVSATGTVYSGNMEAGTISTTGNITGNNFNSAGNAEIGNVVTTGLITAIGNVDAGNLRTLGNVSAAGNVDAINLRTVGEVSASGNVTSAWFVGNVDGNILTSGNVNTSGDVTATNVIGGTLSTVGNVLAGNLSLSGNIISDIYVDNNFTVANTIATSNLVASYANINTSLGLDVFAGDIRVTEDLGQGGNITANLINTYDLSLSGNVISEANFDGNITVFNNITGANLSVSGNVLAGGANINSPTGLVISSGNIEVIEDLGSGGSISATGNITANNTVSFSNIQVLGGDPVAATDTTIAFKIPVTINGNVYYIALTAAQ